MRACALPVRLMRAFAHYADGLAGWADDAPYDRIVINAAVAEAPPALLAQLKPGGALAAPLGEGESQRLGRWRAGAQEDFGPVKFQPIEPGLGGQP